MRSPRLLRDSLARQGDWLFRWRSYIPLLLVPPVAADLLSFRFPLDSPLLDEILEGMCFAIAFCGLAVRGLVAGYAPRGTSGRITSGQKAAELNTAGMYSLCRNPLYLGNFLMGFGVLLFLHSFVVQTLYVLTFFLYYERIIMREEEFLHGKFGESYLRWADRTPAIVPRFRAWRRPALSFSWRTILRREYTSFFAVAAIMTAFEVVGDTILEGRFTFEPEWRAFFGFSLAFYLACMFLKKGTRLLHVPGR